MLVRVFMCMLVWVFVWMLVRIQLRVQLRLLWGGLIIIVVVRGPDGAR